MQSYVHGGDIYSARQEIEGEILDFSANLNPLGLPEGVCRAAEKAIAASVHYPDPFCRELREKISACERIPTRDILCGNGAADLIFRLALALKPQNALLLAPAFAEYAQALSTIGCHIQWYFLQEKEGFCLTEEFLDTLTSDLDLLILCNPNNPTGEVVSPLLMEKILKRCAEKEIFLLLDECFVDFLDQPERYTLTRQVEKNSRLMILKAFTKLYAMAGLRLGYCLCSREELMERMSECAQPWSVSIPAQAAGVAALEERNYRQKTKELIRKERKFLREGLEKLNYRVYGSKANFVFFRDFSKKDLTQKLRQKGILIRSCGNYVGLDNSYYRIAVRTHRENQILLSALKE